MADFYVVCVQRDDRGEIVGVGLESPVDHRVSPFPAPIESILPLLGHHHRFFVKWPFPATCLADASSFAAHLAAAAGSLPDPDDILPAAASRPVDP